MTHFRDAKGNLVKVYKASEPMFTPPASDGPGLGEIVKSQLGGIVTRASEPVASTATGAAGGFLVAGELASWLIDLARPKARVMQAGAMSVEMPNGSLRVGTITGDAAAANKTENAPYAISQGVYGNVVLIARTMGVIVPVSLELLMSASNIDSILATMISENIAVAIDNAAINGTGAVNTAHGILAQAQAVDLSGAVLGTSGNYKPFVQAIVNVLAANADPANLSVLMNSDLAGQISLLTDTVDQTLRPPPLYCAIRKAGREFVTNNLTTAPAVGEGFPTTTGLVGDFSNVVFGFQRGVMIEASRAGSYTNADGSMGHAFGSGKVLIRATVRYDVAIQRPSFFNAVTGIGVQFAAGA